MSGHGAPSAFGNYRVLHQIGSGVLGPVFRSFDPQRDRIVAVKAFKLDLLPEDVARLAASLRRLVGAGFSHPHHVALVDAGLEGTTPFLVTEYVSGETLDVARRQLATAPAAATLPWLRQLAGAIDEAHGAGQRHGSLHPRDVLIAGRTGGVRITGFGVASALEAVGARLPIRRPFTAPERTSGDPWDVRADVYSLAAIAHELLTGRRPAGPGEQDGALAGGLSPEQRVAVRKVLATGLAERPDLRFDSASALVQALDAAVNGGQPELPFAAAVATSDPPVADKGVEQSASPEPAPAIVLAKVEFPDAPDVAPVETVETTAVSDAHESGSRRGHDVLSILERPEPPIVTPSHEPSRYPWSAIAAALLAGLVAGGALGYRVGIDRAAPPPTAPVATAPAPGPGDTEVAVAADPAARPEPDPSPPAAIDSRAERAAAPTGQLIVQSAPAGALVTIDGRYRGETPLTIRDLPLGAHTVRIARPGHVPWSERVSLTAASPARVVSTELQPGLDAPSRISGSLYVDSRPRGARVMIDGRFVGTTPFRMPGVDAGRHEIRIELDGYRAVSTPVTVTAAREARVAVTLEPGAGLPGSRGPVR